MLYNKFDNRRIITGEIVTLTPLFIGKGTDSLNPVEVDNGVLKDGQGNPLIPGSSLKGVLRSSLESILRASSPEYDACDILDKKDDSCSRDPFMKSLRKQSPALSSREIAEEIYKKNCDVCNLFGGYFFAGKLQIKDLYYLGERCRFEYRDGVGIDRDTGTQYNGAKYDYEVVPAGERFGLTMIAENLEKKQVKLLEWILNLLKSGELSLGGKVSRGLGQIRLENDHVELINSVEALKKYYGWEKEEKDNVQTV